MTLGRAQKHSVLDRPHSWFIKASLEQVEVHSFASHFYFISKQPTENLKTVRKIVFYSKEEWESNNWVRRDTVEHYSFLWDHIYGAHLKCVSSQVASNLTLSKRERRLTTSNVLPKSFPSSMSWMGRAQSAKKISKAWSNTKETMLSVVQYMLPVAILRDNYWTILSNTV